MSGISVRLLSFDDDPPIGGQGVVVAHLRSELERQGVHTDTIASRGKFARPYKRFLYRAPLDFSLMVNRLGPMLFENTDLLHVQGGPGGVLLLRRSPIPVVYSANHTYSQAHRLTNPKRALSVFERVAYRRASQVIAISRSTADELVRMGIPASRVHLVHPGVERPVLKRAVERDPLRVVFVGRLEREKGVMDALTAMIELRHLVSGVSGVIIGDGAQRTQVLLVARQHGISVLGKVSRQRLLEEMARASVLLMPSRYEGLGLVALEAAALGTVPVGYAVPGLTDALDGTGYAVTPFSPLALISMAHSLLTDRKMWAEQSERGKEKVARDYSWEMSVRKTIGVYRLALGQ